MSYVEIWYMAHPVGADTPEGVTANLLRAARWLRWLRHRCPRVVIIAPWLGPLLAGTERDDLPEDRERGLRDCVETAKRCDGIILCGGLVSSGMQLELDAVCDYGQGQVSDLTSLGAEPPADFDELYPAGFYDDPTDPLELGRMRWAA